MHHWKQHEFVKEMPQNDYYLSLKVCNWVKIAKQFNPEKYGPNWFPTEEDLQKSRLFWRLRQNKDPLLEPPPKWMGFPWYEVIEFNDKSFVCPEVWRGDKYTEEFKTKILVNQCFYDLVEIKNENYFVLKYNNYRFNFQKAPQAPDMLVWTIQYVKE